MTSKPAPSAPWKEQSPGVWVTGELSPTQKEEVRATRDPAVQAAIDNLAEVVAAIRASGSANRLLTVTQEK